MKRVYSFFVALFFITLSNGQITSVYNKNDSTKTSLKSKVSNEYLQTDSIKKDTLKLSKYIRIKRSLLDSLLSPFYSIKVDSLLRDTIYYNRYRMVVNSISHDTSFVQLPKKQNYISVPTNQKLSPIVLKDPIKTVQINKLNYKIDSAWWVNKNKIGFDMNQVSFLNWSAGGSNSIAGLLKIHFKRTYRKSYTTWNNELALRYGLNRQQDKGTIKTDDELKMSSTFGYRKDTLSKWYYTAKFNFNTQLTDGYKYPDTKEPISRFFAPAYLFLGIGTHYELTQQRFSLYISPITFKSTFVFDEALSNSGSFGVEPGRNTRMELGIFMESKWETEIFKNVAMINRLNLYTDYINNFGNIDVDWNLIFRFKINKFLEANFNTHLIYDDDIKYKEDSNGDGELETFGARVQLKQQLGVGFLYSF